MHPLLIPMTPPRIFATYILVGLPLLAYMLVGGGWDHGLDRGNGLGLWIIVGFLGMMATSGLSHYIERMRADAAKKERALEAAYRAWQARDAAARED